MGLPCVNRGGIRSVIRLNFPVIIETEMALPPDAVRALSVWNVRPGAILTIADDLGAAYRARLAGSERVVPFECLGSVALPSVPLTLYQALPEKERF